MAAQALQQARSVARFVAFARGDERQMVDARVGTQLASLLPALFSCDDAVGMVQTFDTEEQALGWLS